MPGLCYETSVYRYCTCTSGTLNLAKFRFRMALGRVGQFKLFFFFLKKKIRLSGIRACKFSSGAPPAGLGTVNRKAAAGLLMNALVRLLLLRYLNNRYP
eukprot:SAG31_NODE_1610_length_7751_cov_2.938447_6_plen_99_part_00